MNKEDKTVTNDRRNRTEANEVAFYSTIYQNEAYNKFGNKLRLKRELHSLLSLAKIKKLNKVLSIGCGDGEFERLLSPYANQIVGVDISPEAITLAKKKQEEASIHNIEYKCESFYDLKWDQKFDVIVCLAFLHHVNEQDMPKFLKVAYDHVAPGGFFYSQDPNIKGVLRFIGRKVLGSTYDKYHTPDERELNPEELKAQLHEVGFSHVKISYIDLTLIPLIYMFTKRFEWLMLLSLFTDFIWQHSPLARWSSGFAAISWKK